MSFFTFHYVQSNVFSVETCSKGYYVGTININDISSFDDATGKVVMVNGNVWFVIDNDYHEQLSGILNKSTVKDKSE